jgi:hypothetical protein
MNLNMYSLIYFIKYLTDKMKSYGWLVQTQRFSASTPYGKKVSLKIKIKLLIEIFILNSALIQTFIFDLFIFF